MRCIFFFDIVFLESIFVVRCFFCFAVLYLHKKDFSSSSTSLPEFKRCWRYGPKIRIHVITNDRIFYSWMSFQMPTLLLYPGLETKIQNLTMKMFCPWDCRKVGVYFLALLAYGICVVIKVHHVLRSAANDDYLNLLSNDHISYFLTIRLWCLMMMILKYHLIFLKKN